MLNIDYEIYDSSYKFLAVPDLGKLKYFLLPDTYSFLKCFRIILLS